MIQTETKWRLCSFHGKSHAHASEGLSTSSPDLRDSEPVEPVFWIRAWAEKWAVRQEWRSVEMWIHSDMSGVIRTLCWLFFFEGWWRSCCCSCSSVRNSEHKETFLSLETAYFRPERFTTARNAFHGYLSKRNCDWIICLLVESCIFLVDSPKVLLWLLLFVFIFFLVGGDITVNQGEGAI